MLKKFLVILLLFFLPMWSFAEDDVGFFNQLQITPKLSLGYMKYSYEYGYYNRNPYPVFGEDGEPVLDENGKEVTRVTKEDSEGWEFGGNLPLLSLGLNLRYKQFFVDLLIQRTLSATDKEIHKAIPSSQEGIDYVFQDDTGYEFKRRDYALTIGYSLSDYVSLMPQDNLSIFAGYKVGQTKYNRKVRYIYGSVQSDRTETSSDEYKTSGPFVGLSYGWPMWGGMLGLNASIAQYNGESNYNLSIDGEKRLTSVVDGNTLTYAYGVNWSKILTESTILVASFDTHRYDFEKSNNDGEVFSFEESMYTVKISLLYTL